MPKYEKRKRRRIPVVGVVVFDSPKWVIFGNCPPQFKITAVKREKTKNKANKQIFELRLLPYPIKYDSVKLY